MYALVLMEKSIGKKIKLIRIKYNLSQDRFGYKIGVSGKTVSAYETGRTIPSLRVLENIASVYKISVFMENNEKLLAEKLEYISNSLNELRSYIA